MNHRLPSGPGVICFGCGSPDAYSVTIAEPVHAAAPGRCRSGAGVAVVARRCRRPRSGSSTRPSPGCTCPRRGTGRCAVQTTGLRAGAGAGLAGVGLRARVAVVAGGAVGLGRVRADAGRRVAGAGVVALVAAPCRRPGCAPVQAPAWQVSVCVQALPSLHAVPFGAFGFEHDAGAPGCRCRRRGTGRCAVQTTGLAPVQAPAWQVSVCVQALPSLHAVPLAALGFEQTPVAGLQVPATWHWSLRACRRPGCAPAQAPAWQVSVCVQALPSLHAVPLRRVAERARGVRADVGRAGVAVVAGSVRRAAEAVVEGQRADVRDEHVLCRDRAPGDRRSAARKVLRATTIAVSCTSTPSDSELTAPSNRAVHRHAQSRRRRDWRAPPDRRDR